MWTSSYLPTRGRLFLLISLGVLAALLSGLLLWVRSLGGCRHGCRRAGAGSPHAQIRNPAAGLSLQGTPGACVRVDGHIVGALPLRAEFVIRRPRRVLIEACKDGYAEHMSTVLLSPGEVSSADLWLSRPTLLEAPVKPSRCACQQD
jgi:hypothetical protein